MRRVIVEQTTEVQVSVEISTDRDVSPAETQAIVGAALNRLLEQAGQEPDAALPVFDERVRLLEER